MFQCEAALSMNLRLMLKMMTIFIVIQLLKKTSLECLILIKKKFKENYTIEINRELYLMGKEKFSIFVFNKV